MSVCKARNKHDPLFLDAVFCDKSRVSQQNDFTLLLMKIILTDIIECNAYIWILFYVNRAHLYINSFIVCLLMFFNILFHGENTQLNSIQINIINEFKL